MVSLATSNVVHPTALYRGQSPQLCSYFSKNVR